MLGQKHLVECHCVLPLYKGKDPIVYHKFTVYSKIDERGSIIPKYVNCNNCGITHHVYEICRSDIKVGKEDIPSVRSVEDISISLPERLVKILKDNERDVSDYEMIEDAFEQDIFPINIIVSREIIDEEYQIKILEIKSKNSFKISSETIKTIIR